MHCTSSPSSSEMAVLGFREGNNFALEHVPVTSIEAAAFRELASRNVDIFVAFGNEVAAAAARAATHGRPVVVPCSNCRAPARWMNPSHTQPMAAPLMSGEFLVHSGEGQAYGEDDADRWLTETGWRKLDRRPLAGPASVIIAEAA